MSKLAGLANRQFELLIIGGGINGAGLARDAALRGLKTLLVDQGDFGGGASSKSSKLVHGGLRYLEHGQLRLVFESLRERARLVRQAGHLVRPREFLLPLYRGDPRPPWKIRIGFWLYDLLASGRCLAKHRWLSPRAVLAREPRLQAEGLLRGALYGDAQMHDARLCLENILDAEAHEAVCLNYVRVAAFLYRDGRLSGATLEDRLTGERGEARSHAVVNVTGPWADRVSRLADWHAKPKLRPTRGIHVVVPRLNHSHPLYVTARQDGRMVFILPWGDYTLLGTTDTDDDRPPEEVTASAEEVDYLLREANRLFPQARLTRESVIMTFAGLRPLAAHTGHASSVSREHLIVEEESSLITLLGGKYTTYRAVAEELLDFVLDRRGVTGTGPCRTAQHPLPGRQGDVAAAEREGQRRLQSLGLDEASAAHVVATYGTRYRFIAEMLQEAPGLAERLCAHHPHAAAEVVHARRAEHAETLSDWYFRRSWMAYSPCQGRDSLDKVIRLWENEGVTAQALAAQRQAYLAELDRAMAWRKTAG
ncbi:MAG: glycerol-3-phosphate dehydrogenase [Candidatus Omnitrophica bacterium]|nr:glycerol-3-phosphate dehydrogenase [Candidatus Omnitrophota bacterium]